MPDNVQQIKDKLSIVDVVGGYVKLERAGRSLRARCPFHKERTPSFYVSPERGTYYCFGCGEKGDVFSFVQKIDGLEFRDALKMLAERAGVQLKEYKGEKGPTKDERERLLDLHEDATNYFISTLKKRSDVREYLMGRGLAEETIAKWRLGYAEAQWRSLTDALRGRGYSDAELIASGLVIRAERDGQSTLYDRFRGRVMFPISDVSGRVIAFSGRHFEAMPGGSPPAGGEPAKYMNSPETPLFRKSKALYGLDRAKATMRRHDFAILVEGQMDLLMMHQSGFPTAVAASGTALTEEHLKAIKHLALRLVLALDSDEAGRKSALRSTMLALIEGFDVRIASFPAGKDPADIGREDPEALRHAVREAKPAVEFFLASARERGRDERAVRRLAEAEVMPLVAAMPSAIDQAHFVQLVARALELPEESIRASVAAVRSPKQQPEEDKVAAENSGPLSRLMHASALLLLVGDAADREALSALLSAQQLAEAEDAAEAYRERLLFSMERDGTDTHAKELLSAVEVERINEQIAELNRAMRTADAGGHNDDIHELSTKLLVLKRRKEDLEK